MRLERGPGTGAVVTLRDVVVTGPAGGRDGVVLGPAGGPGRGLVRGTVVAVTLRDGVVLGPAGGPGCGLVPGTGTGAAVMLRAVVTGPAGGPGCGGRGSIMGGG